MIRVHGVIPWSAAERQTYEELPSPEIHIATSNMAATLAFYEHVFGLRAIAEDDGLVIVPATARTDLVFHDVGGSAPRPEAFVRELGFVVSNVDDARAWIRELGVPIARDSGATDQIFQWSNGRSLYVRAPDGVEIEIAEMWNGALRRYRVIYAGARSAGQDRFAAGAAS